VKIETTRTAGLVRLRHAVGFTASTDDVVAHAAPVIAAALTRREPVALALRPATERALATVLPVTPALTGSTNGAAELVHLARPDGPDRSGQTLAARWARELRTVTRGRSGVTVVVEHDADHDGLDGAFWTELDAALNIALAEVAATVVCLYPQLPLHLEVVDGARRNHGLLLERVGQGGRVVLRQNPEYREARDVLAGRGAPAPSVLGPPDRRIPFDTWQLVTVREAVATAARAAGCDRHRVDDLVLAVNEVATNAVEHGKGDAHLALWTGPGTRGLVCEVHDGGRLTDPLPGLRAPHTADPRGRGLWIARQLCDLLHVWSDDAGTHVRIRALP
jgi:anti-sigma regulatory factor (Ser/Thr protein kinase)